MSKKLVFVIILIIAVPVIFYFLTLWPKKGNQLPVTTTTPTVTPSPTPPLLTNLSMVPDQIVLASRSANINVTINTQNQVTAVQLELSFDPNAVTVNDIRAGTYFDKEITLFKKIDAKNGRATFLTGLAPAGKPKTGTGVVATISLTTNLKSGEKTTISLLPTTAVGAVGIKPSVLKSVTGTTIYYLKGPSSTNSAVFGPKKPQ